MGKRQSINVPGLSHGANPIPAASKVGPLLMSGGVIGFDPATGDLPEDVAAQCANMFHWVRELCKAAGGSTEDIAKMTMFVADMSSRALINEHWVAMFPDEANRPARHTQLNPNMKAPMQIQCDIVAYIG